MRAQEFMHEVARTLRCDERRADAVTFVVFQELRDRLTPNEAADVAAQLPERLRALWEEGKNQIVSRVHREEFVGHVRQRAALPNDAEAERAVLAVFGALQRLLGSPSGTEGEAWDVWSQLPKDMKKLWLQAAAPARRRRGRPMRVGELMTRGVRTCHPRDTLSAAAQTLWTGQVGCVPVVEDARVVGMLTDRDVCGAAYVHCRPLHALRVAAAMSAEVVTCRPDDGVEDALAAMRAHGVQRLPVVDGDARLVGLLSLTDVAAAAARSLSAPAGALDPALVAETIAVVHRHAA